MSRLGQITWDETAIAKLRTLWAEGLSTAEIGRRLGCSNNAVTGKAHRLNLPPRPSPIRHDDAETIRLRREAAELAAARWATMAAGTLPAIALQPEPVAPVWLPVPVRTEEWRIRPAKACCWPIGMPRTPGFRFCGDPCEGRGSYCGLHQAQATGKGTRSEQDAHKVAAGRA